MNKEIKEKANKIIFLIEKIIKTDIRYLIKGGIWLTIGQIASSLLSLLLTIIFANFLSQESYGIYKYILTIAGVLSISSLSGMDTAITQTTANGDNFDVLIPATKSKIKWGLIGGIGSLLVASYYYFKGNILLTESFVILAFFVPLIDSFATYSAVLQGRKEFKKLTKYSVISQIVSSFLILGTILLTKNILIITFSYFASWTLVRFVFFYKTAKGTNSAEQNKNQTISYGKHLSLMKGINMVSGNFGSFFIFNIIGGAGLATFTMASAPAEKIRALINNINTLIFPKLANEQWQMNDKKIFLKKIAPFLLVLSIGILFYILLTPLFYNTFFKQYHNAILYSQIYSISIIFTAINALINNILRAKKRVQQLYTINTVDSLLNIILIIPLIYFWQIWGYIAGIIIIKIIDMILGIRLTFNHKTDS